MPKRRKRTIEATVEIDGVVLRWELRHDPQWDPQGAHRGHSISVCLADGAHRELLLEYPFPKDQPRRIGHLPERPKISEETVKSHIRLAIEAGWNPDSRGRPFHFPVPDRSP
jgi:hypothetical protein